MSSISRDFLAGSSGSRQSVLWRAGVAVLSPLVLSMAFPKIDAGWLALVALVPLFWLWAKSSWKTAFRWGWLSGAIFFFIMFFWMTNSLGDYIGEWKLLAGAILAIVQGLAFAGVAALTSLVCRGEIGALAVFALPAAWLLVESVRTRGALGVPFAELGLVAAHMSWLLPIAAFVGVYGITAIVALCNTSVLGVIAGTKSARIAGLAAVAGIIAIVIVADVARSRISIAAPTVHVAVAQGNISQRDKWSPAIFQHTMAVYSDLTQKAAAGGAKIVIWPETAVTSYPLQDPSLLAYLQRLAVANSVWLFAGTIDRPQKTELYNSVIAISPSGVLQSKYDKHILVPFAEYLPLDRFLRGLPLFSEASQFVAGPGPSMLAGAGMRFGVLVCYESAFAPYAREIANAGAGALVIVTDDAWFGHTSGPYQHAEMAVVDAVETGRWVVRGGDTGISEIIDPKGSVVARLDLDNAGVLLGAIGDPIDAPYVRWGIGWLLALAVVVLAFALVRHRSVARGWRSRRGRA